MKALLILGSIFVLNSGFTQENEKEFFEMLALSFSRGSGHGNGGGSELVLNFEKMAKQGIESLIDQSILTPEQIVDVEVALRESIPTPVDFRLCSNSEFSDCDDSLRVVAKNFVTDEVHFLENFESVGFFDRNNYILIDSLAWRNLAYLEKVRVATHEILGLAKIGVFES